MNGFRSLLPYFAKGVVVKGFGRGSKELGVPTANFSDDVVNAIPDEIPCGVYYGWAKVDEGSVYKTVLCIGWNPFFKNQKKSMEAHLIHKFDEDFYGSCLRLVIVGWIREQMDFNSLDELISAIQNDIAEASRLLDESKSLADHPFFDGSQTLVD